MKTCTGCGVEKPLDDFFKEKLGKYGRRSRCKVCFTAATSARQKADPDSARKLREYRARNPEKVRAWGRAYTLTPQRKAYLRRCHEENSERIAERRRVWLRKNPEKVVAWAEKRRALKAGSDTHYTPQEWLDLCESYGNVCLCCGRSDVSLTVDHVIPLSAGGSNGIENIQPLCRSCNARKSTKTTDYRPDDPPTATD